MGSKAVKLNFLLEEKVSRDLHNLVPAGRRSKVVNEAIKKELSRLKRQATTEKLSEYRDKGAKVSMESIVEALRSDRRAH